MLRILYVEDDDIATSIGKSMLNLFNDIEFIHAEDGYTALGVYQPHKFDLLVVDLGLPDISGVELIQLIKKQYGNTPPVVAITAHVDPKCAAPLGISRVYAKPLTYELVKELYASFK